MSVDRVVPPLHCSIWLSLSSLLTVWNPLAPIMTLQGLEIIQKRRGRVASSYRHEVKLQLLILQLLFGPQRFSLCALETSQAFAVTVWRVFVSYLTSAGVVRLLRFNGVIYQCDLNVSHECSFFIHLPHTVFLILVSFRKINQLKNLKNTQQKNCIPVQILT